MFLGITYDYRYPNQACLKIFSFKTEQHGKYRQGKLTDETGWESIKDFGSFYLIFL